jgi:hypothetical protein
MHRVYADLGRGDLAFRVAAEAVGICPDPRDAGPLLRTMFLHHAGRGEAAAAVDVFLRQAACVPERPVVDRWEIEPLLAGLGRSLDAPARPASAGARRDHALYPAAAIEPGAPVAAGRGLPVELARLAEPLRRHATVVAELTGAEVFLRNDGLAVVDRDGNLALDLSLGPYPGFLRDRVAADPDALGLTLDEAVVVLDPFPAPNLGHFLLDQISRLGLYQRAGAGLPAATVIGPRLRPGFQQAIAARAPVGDWLFTDIVARVRVGRLWVSTECRELQHPAQLCAPWALAWLRERLGGATRPGHRRLFVSRADAPTRRLVNEPELLAVLRRRGFEVIVPERMPYEDQLAAFRDASHVVACHGAALAHLVLCAPGTHVLEMFHPLYGTWAYAMLAAASGLRHAALLGRDGVSDAPELNEPAAAGPLLGRFGERDLRIDAGELGAWLEAVA